MLTPLLPKGNRALSVGGQSLVMREPEEQGICLILLSTTTKIISVH